jgi:hypothetical protein
VKPFAHRLARGNALTLDLRKSLVMIISPAVIVGDEKAKRKTQSLFKEEENWLIPFSTKLRSPWIVLLEG